VAVGLAVTELGFRVADVGEALHYGAASSSVGMWLMTAAWVIGALGAVVAVLAARRHARIGGREAEATPAPLPVAVEAADPPGPPVSGPTWGSTHWSREPQPDASWAVPEASDRRPAAAGPASHLDTDSDPLSVWAPSTPEVTAGGMAGGVDATNVAGPTAPPNGPATPVWPEGAAAVPGEPAAPLPGEPPATNPADVTEAIPVEPTAAFAIDSTSAVPVGAMAAVPVDAAPSGPYGVGPTVLVVVLALITAGAFLPAWDRYVGFVATTGRSVTFSLGNAFSGPWPLILGNVLAALALAMVPILVTRLRDRAVAALVVVGSLLVLASQFTSAIVQANQPVPPSVAGLTPAQSTELGLQLHLSLTGWFTLDVLAAYALFAAVMVIGYLRPATAQENSAGTWPTAPEARSPASLPWS
jgi:hypothetical protein